MKPTPRKFIFDTNVIDRLSDDERFSGLVFKHQKCGEFKFALSRVQIEELNSVRDRLGKHCRYWSLGMALLKLNYYPVRIPMFDSTKNFLPAGEFYREHWQRKFLELYSVHPEENDCLIALSALACGGKVVTGDKDFIKRIPKTTLSIDKFQERLERHDSKCGGSFTNDFE